MRMPNLRPRFGSFGGGGAAAEGGSGFTGAKSYELMNAKTGKAAAALKGSVAGGDDDGAAANDEPPLPEVAVPLPAPLAKWRAGGHRHCEMEATCSFHADCLAVGGRDGDVLASIGGDGDGKSVSVYSAQQKKVVTSLAGHTDLVCSVAVRIDGEVIASGSRDKTIRIWSVASGECAAVLEGCEEMVCGLAFHPAAKRRDWLLSGEKGGVARLWSTSRGVEVCHYQEHSAPIWSVAMGTAFGVSASHDKHAKVWPLPSDDEAAEWKGGSLPSRSTLPHPNWVFSVSVAKASTVSGPPGGQRLISVSPAAIASA